MSQSGVSVIVPAYNHAAFLETCIRSLVDQSQVPLEVWVINDGSTDDTQAVLDELKLKFQCLKVIHKVNEGVSAARNVGLDHATKEFIQFLDADDLLEPGKIQFQWKQLIENPQWDLVYGPSLLFGPDIATMTPGFSVSGLNGGGDQKDILTHLVRYIPFQIGTALIRRSAIGLTRFDPALKASEDWKFILELGLKGIRFQEAAMGCPALLHRQTGDKKLSRSYFEAEMKVRAFIRNHPKVDKEFWRLSEKQRRWYSLQEYRRRRNFWPFTRNLFGFLFSLPLKTRTEWKMLIGEVLFPEWYQWWKQKII